MNISATAIAGHVFAFAGGILVVAAFAGLGRIVQRTSREDGSLYEAIALGFVLNLIVGSLLNWLGAISLATVIAIEVVGLLAVIWDRQKLIYEIKSDFNQPYLLLVVALFYLLSVTNVAFNWADDFNGYLIPVEKIIQTHQLGTEPFLAERFMSVGSHFYAQAFYVLQFGYGHLSLFDPGLARIIIGLLLVERLGKYFPTYPGLTLSLLTSGLLVAWTWNTAAPLAIVTALLTLLTFEVVERKTRPVLFGLLGAAAISLKVSAAPYVGLLGLIWLLSNVRELGIWYAARAAIFTGLCGALTLLLWMLSLYASSRTLMYPVLGQGYYMLGPVYRYFTWDALWHTVLIRANLLAGNLIIIFGAVVLIIKSERESRWLVTLTAVSAFACMLLIIYGTAAGDDSFRYTLPICASFGIVALVKFMNENLLQSYRVKAIFALLALAAAVGAIPARTFLIANKDNLVALISGRTAKLEDLFSRRDSLRQAQQLVPEHERILTLTDTAMMLDFVRNPIWATGDDPGESSPPPGISNLTVPSELRSFLLNLGISYVLLEPNMIRISDVEAKSQPSSNTLLQNPLDYYESLFAVRSYQNFARLAEESTVQWSNEYEVIKLAP